MFRRLFADIFYRENKLFAAPSTQSHSLLATVGEAETGFKRNSNCCIIRSPYGYVLRSESLKVLYSMSEVGNEYEWMYRIYAHTVLVSE